MKSLYPGTIKRELHKLLEEGLLIRHDVSLRKALLVITLHDRAGLYYLPGCIRHVLAEYFDPETTAELFSKATAACNAPLQQWDNTAATLYGTAPETAWITVHEAGSSWCVLLDLDPLLKQGRGDSIAEVVAMTLELLKLLPLPQLSVRRNCELIQSLFNKKVTLKQSVAALRRLEKLGVLQRNGHFQTKGRDVDRGRLFELLLELEK